MYTTQTALIAHLTAAGLSIETIAAYAGDLKPDKAAKLRGDLPAVYVMFMGGKPIAEERSLEFDLLICTRSDSFDRATNLTNNLQLSGQVADYLEANPEFSDASYGYNINQDDLDAELLLQDDRYTIIALHLVVGKYTDTS